MLSVTASAKSRYSHAVISDMSWDSARSYFRAVRTLTIRQTVWYLSSRDLRNAIAIVL